MFKKILILSTQLPVLLCLQQFFLSPMQHFGSLFNIKGILLVQFSITDIVLIKNFVFSKIKTGILVITFCGALRLNYRQNYINWLYVLFLNIIKYLLYPDTTSSLAWASLWSCCMHCVDIMYFSFRNAEYIFNGIQWKQLES